MRQTADAAATAAVLTHWRRYLQGRAYARETVWARVSIARRWIRWVDDWRAADHRAVEGFVAEQGLSPRAARNLVSHLRAFYRWAMREDLVAVDPTTLVDSPRLPSTLPRPARDDQIAYVLADADAELAAIIGLMSCGGLRCCEVARLDVDDVDLVEGAVHVLGKGSKDRRVFLSPDVLKLLEAVLPADPGPVFRPPRTARYSPARISQRVNAAFRAAGYSTTAHQLRHRAATSALRVPGADLLAVRDLLGHASVATTQIYTKVVEGRAAATSRAITVPARGDRPPRSPGGAERRRAVRLSRDHRAKARRSSSE